MPIAEGRTLVTLASMSFATKVAVGAVVVVAAGFLLRTLRPDDVGDVVRKAVEATRGAADSHQVYLYVDVPDDLPVVWRGSGSHLSPEVAVSRALTEAAQSRLTFISGARDDLPELAPGLWTRGFFETFETPEPRRRFEDLEDLSTSDVARDLGRVVEKLEAHHLEPFSVDLSDGRPFDSGPNRSDLGISVVLSFVPGLMEVGHG